MKRFGSRTICYLVAAAMLAPVALTWAAGEPARDLVVVADTRILSDGFIKYIADLYNHDMVAFAGWATVLTACYGAFLGFLMDFLMARTGLDLKSRKIVEH